MYATRDYTQNCNLKDGTKPRVKQGRLDIKQADHKTQKVRSEGQNRNCNSHSDNGRVDQPVLEIKRYPEDEPCLRWTQDSIASF